MRKLLKITYVPLAVLGLTLTSCDQEEANVDDIVNLSCKINTVSSASSFESEWSTNESSSEVAFTYTDNLVTKVEEGYSIESCYFDEQGGTHCSTENSTNEFRFTYEGNKLTKISVYIDGLLEVEGLAEYSDGKLSKFIVDFEGDKEEYRFLYTNGKLTKFETWDEYLAGSPNNLALNRYVTYTWTGENVTKEEGFQVYEGEDEGGRKSQVESKLGKIFKSSFVRANASGRMTEYQEYSVSYTYDNKQNPFQGNPYNFIEMKGGFFGKNNAIALSSTYNYYSGESENYTESYEFTYNSQGFPTSVLNDDGEPTTIIYNCD